MIYLTDVLVYLVRVYNFTSYVAFSGRLKCEMNVDFHLFISTASFLNSISQEQTDALQVSQTSMEEELTLPFVSTFAQTLTVISHLHIRSWVVYYA